MSNTKMLERLHGTLRRIDMAAPPFTDRLAGVQHWLADDGVTPDLVDEDRELLAQRLEPSSRLLTGVSPEQLLHGEPHPWNMLNTVKGPLFISTSRTVPADRSSTTWRGCRQR